MVWPYLGMRDAVAAFPGFRGAGRFRAAARGRQRRRDGARSAGWCGGLALKSAPLLPIHRQGLPPLPERRLAVALSCLFHQFTWNLGPGRALAHGSVGFHNTGKISMIRSAATGLLAFGTLAFGTMTYSETASADPAYDALIAKHAAANGGRNR